MTEYSKETKKYVRKDSAVITTRIPGCWTLGNGEHNGDFIMYKVVMWAMIIIKSLICTQTTTIVIVSRNVGYDDN